MLLEVVVALHPSIFLGFVAGGVPLEKEGLETPQLTYEDELDYPAWPLLLLHFFSPMSLFVDIASTC